MAGRSSKGKLRGMLSDKVCMLMSQTITELKALQAASSVALQRGSS